MGEQTGENIIYCGGKAKDGLAKAFTGTTNIFVSVSGSCSGFHTLPRIIRVNVSLTLLFVILPPNYLLSRRVTLLLIHAGTQSLHKRMGLFSEPDSLLMSYASNIL
jgi:hypothetical protein